MFDWIAGAMLALGVPGVALLMFAENVFPPIPSEVLMPLAGFLAARGEVGFLAVVAAGSLGSLAGAALWYWIGRRLGAERVSRIAARHGRWLTMTPEDVHHATLWFERHGPAAVLLGRLVPAVRTLISVPAGVAGMPFWRFLGYSAVGTAIWTTLLGTAGFLLEARYHRVAHWLDPATTVIVAVLVCWYFWRVATWKGGQ